MIYLDTSVLVAALTREASTERIQGWLAQQRPEELTVSRWGVTEFSSALSIKLRTGQIELQHRAEALAAFNRLVAETFTVLPVRATHFITATRFVEHQTLGLRAADALHLAIAADRGAVLATLDQKLIDAAEALGVSSLRP